jgi:hypothetical protein
MEENFPKFEDFTDSLVAFIDVLGFDQRARSIKDENDFFEVGNLLYTTNLIAQNLSNVGGVLENFRVTAISDSIIATVPFSDPVCTVGMLNILHNIQYEMVATNFKTLVRGYICRGPVYHKGGLLFGSGYSEAYKGEKTIGSAPRIILAPEVVNDAIRVISQYSGKEKMVTALNYLQQDNCDGFYFIDYLKPVGTQSVLPKEQLLEERAAIKSFIEEALHKYRDDHGILPKYKWLENYFYRSASYF